MLVSYRLPLEKIRNLPLERITDLFIIICPLTQRTVCDTAKKQGSSPHQVINGRFTQTGLYRLGSEAMKYACEDLDDAILKKCWTLKRAINSY